MDVMEVTQKVQLSACLPAFSRQFFDGLVDYAAAARTLRPCKLNFLLGGNPAFLSESLLSRFFHRWLPNSRRSKDTLNGLRSC